MSRIKNQHTVPQSYLRRFATEGKIWVFDKVTRHSFLSHVRNVASETSFYDFDSEVLSSIAAHLDSVPETELLAEVKRRLLDPQFVERDLAEMEAGYAATVDELLQQVRATGSFTRDMKERMAYYLTKQLLRTTTFRTTHLERTNKVLQEVSQMAVAMKFGPEAADGIFVSLDEKHAAYEHARMMYDPDVNQTYIAILFNHIWYLGVNHTQHPLYTSDNPITMRSHLNASTYGIGSPGIEIMFPLSPQYVLVLWDRQHFAPLASWEGQALELAPDNVLYYNSEQVLESYRQVYCSAADFELAVDICAKHPHVCDPERERIQVIGGMQDWRKQQAKRATQRESRSPGA